MRTGEGSTCRLLPLAVGPGFFGLNGAARRAGWGWTPRTSYRFRKLARRPWRHASCSRRAKTPVNAARLAEASAIPFREATARNIDSRKAGWRNDKHAAQRITSLEIYVYPVFGNIAVGEVETGFILKAWNRSG